MQNFADILTSRIKDSAPICVGLDPHIKHIPDFLLMESKSKADAVLIFNKGIIDSIADLVPVVKPQIAFYEALGVDGMRVYSETIQYAREKGLLVVADIKRGDIGSTAEAYAVAHLDPGDFECDAVTLSPYLGQDSVDPFIQRCEQSAKGLFILVKTSNPSSRDLQDVNAGMHTVYQMMAKKVAEWGKTTVGDSGYSAVGAVVGATYPQEAKILREIMPGAIFLVPGYGAQGGSADDVKPCFKKDGTGAIINSSRGVIFAYESDPKYLPQDYARAAREAVEVMRKDLILK
jgi:orotidine-5'-phosphate decarboxylase